GEEGGGERGGGRITAVGDDRVILHRRIYPRVAKGQEQGMVPGQLVNAGGKPLPEGVEEEIGPVARQEGRISPLQGVPMPDESRAKGADGTPIETAAPVGGGDEDEATCAGQRLEEE